TDSRVLEVSTPELEDVAARRGLPGRHSVHNRLPVAPRLPAQVLTLPEHANRSALRVDVSVRPECGKTGQGPFARARVLVIESPIPDLSRLRGGREFRLWLHG